MASRAALAQSLRAMSRAAQVSGGAMSSANSSSSLTASLNSHARPMSFKAGSLVRSSVSGLRCTIFGAYGFVGRYVTALMAGSGTQCIIPYRGDDMEWRHLKVRSCANGAVNVYGARRGWFECAGVVSVKLSDAVAQGDRVQSLPLKCLPAACLETLFG